MTKDIKIDSNIPIPTGCNPRARLKFPFAKMKVGDSFFTEKKRSSMASIIWNRQDRGEYNGKRFVTKTETKLVTRDDGTTEAVTGCRVWRVE